MDKPVFAYLALLITMLLGSFLFIWIRAVWQIGWKCMNASIFYQENKVRFVLCIIGVLIVSLLYTFDESGLVGLLEKQGLGIYTASKTAIGFGIGGVSLIARKSKVDE